MKYGDGGASGRCGEPVRFLFLPQMYHNTSLNTGHSCPLLSIKGMMCGRMEDKDHTKVPEVSGPQADETLEQAGPSVSQDARFSVPPESGSSEGRPSFTRPLFGHGKQVLTVIVILLLLIAAGLIGSFIAKKTTKSTNTVVVNTQSLDSGTLNKLTQQLNGKSQVSQQLTISPSTLFKNDVNVQNNLSVKGTSNLQGAVTTGGNLTVNGSLTATNGASVGGNLTVNGKITAASLSVGSITLSTLSLSGNLTVGGHIITVGTPPNITASVAAAGGTASISGNDSSGTITITTGGRTPIAGEMAIITFRTSYQLAPRVLLTPLNAEAASVEPFVTENSTFFTVRSAATPAASTIYSFNYLVTQ